MNEGLKEIGKGLISFINLFTALSVINIYLQMDKINIFAIIATVYSFISCYLVGYYLIRKGEQWIHITGSAL